MIGKVLQHLANGVAHFKEPYMQPLDAFLATKTEKMDQFHEALSVCFIFFSFIHHSMYSILCYLAPHYYIFMIMILISSIFSNNRILILILIYLLPTLSIHRQTLPPDGPKDAWRRKFTEEDKLKCLSLIVGQLGRNLDRVEKKLHEDPRMKDGEAQVQNLVSTMDYQYLYLSIF